LGRKVRAAAVRVAWSTALSAAFVSGLPAYAADPATDERRRTGVQQTQFQLPPPPVRREPGVPGEEPAPAPAPAPPPALPSRLPYEYRYGSESDATYRKNPDLDKRLKDNSLILRPELNAYVTYRPTNWLETRLGLIADVEILAKGERTVTLPNGDTQFTPHTRDSLVVDEAFFTIHEVTAPFSFTLGRRNFEDARHWLYDTSMDVGIVGFRSGRFQAEASGGRQVAVDLDFLQNEPKDRVETFMLYGDYRAFEGITMAGYTIIRDDRSGQDGTFQLIGARSIGFPVESFSYWADAALLRGHDQAGLSFRGYGFDVGATYRFIGVPFTPNITVGYAFGSGDKNPNDSTNHQFRQTGLQSNESRFAGLSDFKYYGEALDPELSNLKIFTVGAGFRPFRDTSVDVIYHDYELDAFAETLRNAAVTAELNQDPAMRSHDVGRALDVVIGFRNVFGIRRLGVDVRAGKFFPGSAFRNSFINSEGEETFDKANTSTAVVVKLWW
jgi:alginate production protein